MWGDVIHMHTMWVNDTVYAPWPRYGMKTHDIAYITGLTCEEVDDIRDDYEKALCEIEEQYMQEEYPKVLREMYGIKNIVRERTGEKIDISPEDIARAREYPIGEFLKSRNGMASCPFHEDKNPSMNVKKNFYYCHSCGEHGDVIDLAQKLNGWTFKETVEKLK